MPTVADVIVDGLARAGTPRIFVGREVRHVLVDAARRRGLDVVPAPRETTAATMAAVTGELTGVPGAVIVAGDPAAVREPIESALVARAPLVVLTVGSDEAPGTGLAAVTKASLGVSPGSAGHWIAHACQLAMTEPWGPVHLHVGEDVARAAALPVATACRPAPPAPPGADALDAAARLLRGAARPLLIVGLGCRSQTDAAWLRAFAESLPAPALVTPRARGALPDPHPLVIGALGESASATELLRQADLLVAIGLDPLEAPGGWPAGLAVLHLAAAPPAGDVTASVVGDIGLILEELAPRLRERRLADWDVAGLHALKQAAAAPPTVARRLVGSRLVETARRLTPAGTIAVLGEGGAWAECARAWPAVARGELLLADDYRGSGALAAAAAAAQLAYPDRRVVCFTDASALAAAHGELAMMIALDLRVTVVAAGREALELPAGLRTLDASPASFASAFEAAMLPAAPGLVRVDGGLREKG